MASRTAPTFEIYTDRKGEFRWRARARNGNLLAAASEGYVNRRDAVHCAKLFGYDPSVAPPAPAKKTPPAPKKVVTKVTKPEAAVAVAPKPKQVAKPKPTPAAETPTG